MGSDFSRNDSRFEATYYRTALLLGLVKGDRVHRWAERLIERETDPPAPLFEVVSTAPGDLSGLRHALWPLVVDPEPLAVLQALLGLLSADLTNHRRSLADTLTILRQMRSMLRLPPSLYADLTAALVEYAHQGAQEGTLAAWLRQFAGSEVAELHE